MGRKKLTAADPWPGKLVYRKNRIYIQFGSRFVNGISFPRTPDGKQQALLTKKNLYLQQQQELVTRSATNLKNRSEPTIPKRIQASKNIRQVFDAFILAKRRNVRRPVQESTLNAYDLAYRKFIKSEYPIDSIVTTRPLDSDEKTEMYRIESDVIRFIRTQSALPDDHKQKLSPVTTNDYLRGFQTFLNWCTRERYLPVRLELYRLYNTPVPAKKVTITTDDEFQLILSDIEPRDPDFANFLRLLRYMGGRSKETIMLRKEQFNVQDRVIELPNKIHKHKVEYFPITSKIMAIYLEQCERYPDSDRLFPQWKEKSLEWLRIKLKRARTRCGLPVNKGEGFHVLRKSFIDSLFDKNLPLDQIKDLARHSCITTTLNHYRRQRARELGHHLEE